MESTTQDTKNSSGAWRKLQKLDIPKLRPLLSKSIKSLSHRLGNNWLSRPVFLQSHGRKNARRSGLFTRHGRYRNTSSSPQRPTKTVYTSDSSKLKQHGFEVAFDNYPSFPSHNFRQSLARHDVRDEKVPIVNLNKHYTVHYDDAKLSDAPSTIEKSASLDKSSDSRELYSLEVPPFSLLQPSIDLQGAIASAAKICGVQTSQVVDILPCTPLQEGLIALTEIHPGNYVTEHVFDIGEEVDTDRLHHAWCIVAQSNAILRTRIVSLQNAEGHVLLQVTLDEDLWWVTDRDQDSRDESTNLNRMGLGTPLCGFALRTPMHGRSGQLVWKIHHSLFDGWSMSLLLKEVENIYFRRSSPGLRPMSQFIKYLSDRNRDTDRQFWMAMFENSQGNHFPSLKPNDRAVPNSQMEMDISDMSWDNSNFTPATILKAAWAVATANSTGSSESLFGLTVTGRQAPLEGIELISGPTITTVPLAIQLDWDKSINQLLKAVQDQSTDMILYEQTGLQNISRMSDKTAIGCNFQSLIVIQPAAADTDSDDRAFLTEAVDVEGKSRYTSDTYPLVIECSLGANGVHLRVAFDCQFIQQDHLSLVVSDFVSVLKQFSQNSAGDQSLQRVHGDSWDIYQAFSWNAEVPQPTSSCIHDLIKQRVMENPSRPAIRSWDGNFTYQEMDDMSTRLALHLCDRGVGGKIVPILFEKSRWMPIAAVAVMKAGGGCLALDSQQPPERLRSIMAQAAAPLVLSSVKNESLSSQVSNHTTILIGPDQEWQRSTSMSTLPTVDPSDVLYICFTSGSTGIPKGAIVTHGNFASAITYQQKDLGFSPSSRVFDFSSYTFDAAWCNLIHSLTSGGCLCIPSQVERDNDLAGCLERYDVNHIDLTPSMARIVDEKALSRLSTLILGGEAVLPGDASLVAGKTKIINVYGPAECTPTVTFAEITPGNITIGRGAGVCTWVIDPETNMPSKLGAVGELWVEGPLIGQGYFNNDLATGKAFIQDPAWLTRSTPNTLSALKVRGRQGRLYRTGDMVYYNAGGSLSYVGRTDTQVKVRGQRVELGEVEQHVLNSLPDGTAALITAEAIRLKKSGSVTIVVFITLKGEKDSQMTDEEHNSAVSQLAGGLQSRLVESIPRFLVPTAFIPMLQLPMTASGKTDRNALRLVGESLHHQYSFKSIDSDREESTEPLSDIERLIQKKWMSVLNLSAEECGVNQNFTRIGGDSITAMQIVSQCKLHNITFTIGDLLQASTIRKLASQCKIRETGDSPQADETDKTSGAPFELSPVQQMFFDAYPDGLNHWNQSFLLKLSKPVSVKVLEDALKAVVRRHAMLRCRFQRDAKTGRWSQYVMDEEDPQSFAFSERSVQNHRQIVSIGQTRQESIDLENGPVFAFDLFQVSDGEQIILLSAHHAVIDLVSWRIIWGDIEDFVSHGALISHPTLSFREWCRRQARVGESLSPLSVLPYAVPPLQVDFWGLDQFENTFAGCNTSGFSFDRTCTSALFGACNAALGTEAIDIIIGVLAYTFAQTFPEREAATIWMEGHGREQFEETHCDVSSTVGWFTTVYPLPLPIRKGTSTMHSIRLAKDVRRKIPNKGQPYFSCRYHSESGRNMFKGHDISEIMLNFTGKFQQLENDDGLFKPVKMDENADTITEMASAARRFAMIEIDASIQNDELQVSFDVHKKMKHRDRLKTWAGSFYHQMKSTADELLTSSAALTLSDLPLLPLSYQGLDTLLKEQLPNIGIEPQDVVDIYPCSPFQQGILLSAQKEAASYATFSVWRLVPPIGQHVLLPKLRQAWIDTVNQHTILQTIFTVHPEKGDFIQIVLNNCKPRVTILSSEGESPCDTLTKLQRPLFAAKEPNHAFSICQSSTGEISCRLDINHSLIDGSSMFCILRDLLNGYSDIHIAPRTPFKEVIQYVSSISKTQRIAAWSKLLSGVQPCEFPVSPKTTTGAPVESSGEIRILDSDMQGVAEFCREMGITRSVFIQVAWSMVLSHFTGNHDVCFGYLSNGRDIPVNGIDDIVGPLANLLIGRVDLRFPPEEVLLQTSQNSIKHLSIQHTSLAEIQHHLGLSKRLFNTALSIRGSEKKETKALPYLTVEPHGGEDPHEFDIGVGALIEADQMDVVLEYRQPCVSDRSAQEAAFTFTEAVRFLLDNSRIKNQTDTGAEILYDSFFLHLVGRDEPSTRRFWLDQFANTENSHFPSMLDAQPRIINEVKFHLPGLNLLDRGGLSWENILRGGWAVLASHMLGSNEALFGANASNGTTQVPIRVALNPEMDTGSFLHELQLQSKAINQFDKAGLCRISSMSDETALGCQFQTVVQVVKSQSETQTQARRQLSRSLYVEYQTHEADAQITMIHDSNVLNEQQVLRLGRQLETILRQLLDADSRKLQLKQLSLASPQDVEDIWDWNSFLPQSQEACMHELIAQRARERPEAKAICSWDGELTYRRLDELSTSVAVQLLNSNIGPGCHVPLLFEKSMWMLVAVMAVMKVGATAVATDIATQPEERLRSMTQQVRADIILCSTGNQEIANRLNGQILTVGPDVFSARLAHQTMPIVSPRDGLYIVFTSGSTGTPKGVKVSHRNMSSALSHQNKALGYQRDSRVLDFSSYAFDVFWSNMLNTLTIGACFCIPSPEERQNDLSGALEKYDITLADLTPSIARHITGLDRLSTLVLGGEVVLPSDRQLAGPNTIVISAYGPAECTPTATILNLSEAARGGLGRGAGVCTWIVEPDNESKLAAVGAPGELWLEGPLIGDGYLFDEEKTSKAFIQDPEWLVRGIPGRQPGRRGLLYRTGDLVQYQTDGSIRFLGRKDTQVKLRGQRIELEEVEQAVRRALLSQDSTLVHADVVVEVIQPRDSAQNVLSAFVSLNNNQEDHDLLTGRATANLEGCLRSVLPQYMIPAVFIPKKTIPRTHTGKVDRKRLRSEGSQLTSRNLAQFSGVSGEWRPPRTEAEKLIQRLWAEAITVDAESIGIDDNFFRIGGDSIVAIKLVGLARQNGVPGMIVKDVFQNPILQDLASMCK